MDMYAPDNRVLDTKNKAVVRISTGGSGFIISDHIIVTAAHCVYNRDTQSFIKSTGVTAYNEYCTGMLFNSLVTEIHIPKKYTDISTGLQYDYALIYVSKDLSDLGCFTLGLPTDEFMSSGAEVKISGYPQGTAANGTNKNNLRYISDGYIYDLKGSELFERQVQTTAYASGGDSGGPIFVETTPKFSGQTYKTAIGILTSIGNDPDDSGEFPRQTSFGTRITPELLKFYYDNDNVG